MKNIYELRSTENNYYKNNPCKKYLLTFIKSTEILKKLECDKYVIWLGACIDIQSFLSAMFVKIPLSLKYSIAIWRFPI